MCAPLCIFSKFPGLKDIGIFHFCCNFVKKTSIMAKRQRNLLDMYTKVNSNTSNVEISDSPISQDSHGSSNQLNVIQKENLEWKDVWFDLYDWVYFDRQLGEFSVKFVKKGEANMCMPQMDSSNIKISGLQDHAKSIEHKKTNMGKVWRKTNFKKTSDLD